MGVNFGVNTFGQMTYTSNIGSGDAASSSSTDADLKEYKSLLDKQSKGTLSTKDQSRLKELQTSLSKSGKLNNDGSIKSGRNSDKLRANARKMSWDEVGSIWGCGKTQASGGVSRIVQNTASRAGSLQNRVSSGMMSKNGSIFGHR